MDEFFEMVDLIAKKIKQTEESVLKLSNFLRKFELTKSVEKSGLKNVRIAAVDGGLVQRSFHGFDMILTRACGVLYEYKEGKLVNVDYYPNSNPKPAVSIIFTSSSDFEFAWRSSFERQEAEINLAYEVIKKWEPDFLLLDGSLVPSQLEISNGVVNELYRKWVKSYKKLFNVAKGRLVGAIKDSRGSRFCEEVSKKFEIPKELVHGLETVRDTNLLFYLLKVGERSVAFNYSSNPSKHPVLKEFGEFGKIINVFYIKTAEFDRPIRVELLSTDEGTVDKLSSILLAISGQHPGYGIPSILIEADQRARIKESIIDTIYQDIFRKTGALPSLLKLRGKDRPF
ncbi:MAG TPA: DNA double-strand break repair nuclease NurA [Candidatus Aenigmarchaeota archaeon]|nr:DNA double-strand break repair nuclease NurA [Candidatus Aenigmarchaeota archaeon]